MGEEVSRVSALDLISGAANFSAESELNWPDSKAVQESCRLKRVCTCGLASCSHPNSSEFTLALAPTDRSAEPPFDRHDWLVTRVEPETKEKVETRYVIDYYSAPDDEEGNPVFHLDVRPALDNWRGVWGRVEKTWEEWKTGPQETQA